MSNTTTPRTQLTSSCPDQPERRVEVSVVVDSNGDRQVLLQDMSFGTGVGWYTAKSLRLDAQQVDALVRSLCACRQHPTTRPADRPTSHTTMPERAECGGSDLAEDGEDAKILTFPNVLPSS